MQIASTRLAGGGTLPVKNPIKKTTDSTVEDKFAAGSSEQQQVAHPFRAFAGAALGAGIGVVAGMKTGNLAGLAGASVAALPSAFVGGISGALLAERMGQSDSSRIVGLGLWGAAAGGALGAASAGIFAAQAGGVGAAAGLGVLGALTGLLAAGK